MEWLETIVYYLHILNILIIHCQGTYSDKILIKRAFDLECQLEKQVTSTVASQILSQAPLDFRVWRCLYSELQPCKSDWPPGIQSSLFGDFLVIKQCIIKAGKATFGQIAFLTVLSTLSNIINQYCIISILGYITL